MEERLSRLKFEIGKRKNIQYVLILTCIMTWMLFIFDQINEVTRIDRTLQGEGTQKETLIVERADGSEGVVEIEIGELEYTSEELKEIMTSACGSLETLILGENPSLDHVNSDLNLISRIPDSSIQVQWELSDYSLMDITGTLNLTALNAGGTFMELTAILTCQNETIYHRIPVCLYPPSKTRFEMWVHDLQNAVTEEEKNTRTQKNLNLPEDYLGEKIRWSRPKEQRWISILFLGLASSGLLYLKEREEEKKTEELRRRQMMLDYPGIVNKLTIYTGAGMTLRNAWGKIVCDYEKDQKEKEIRHAYEEMAVTWHELGDGAGEKDCYERFGSRCQVQAYVKLGALLAQNLKKGTKGLSEQLRLEAAHAFEERKQYARKQGEEAGTKLLIPMFGMLAIVLVIVIVPAFLSLQL